MLKQRVAGVVMALVLAAMVYDCGSSKSSSSPAPSPTPAATGTPVTWAAVSTVLQASCGTPGSCHNTGGAGFQYNDISTETNFRLQKANVLAAITNGGQGSTSTQFAMPLAPTVLSAADKATIVNFLGQVAGAGG